MHNILYIYYIDKKQTLKEKIMFKKIALAAALTASASFATWDYFPILDGGKGQAELDVAYFKIEKHSELQIAAAARYSITPNFEFGIGIPFLLYAAYDGESYDDVAGLGKIQLMTRYQFTPNVSAFVDFILPTCGDNTCDDDGAFAFHFGAQYSQKFGIVNFGSELGLQLETAGDNDVTPPWELNIGVEADFEVNPVFVPYVGLETHTLLGKYSYKGDDASKSYTGKTGFDPYFGFTANITPQVYAGAQLRFGIGEDYYGENTLTTITAKVGFNF
jgi:hypothetical protein